jgi:hypothetical protein
MKISKRAIKVKIRKLRVDGAAGPDGLGPLVLEKLIDEITPSLAKVMRLSLSEGAVPEDWRTANVAPIFKKGSNNGGAAKGSHSDTFGEKPAHTFHAAWLYERTGPVQQISWSFLRK